MAVFMAGAYTAKQFLEEEKCYLFKVDYDFDTVMTVLNILNHYYVVIDDIIEFFNERVFVTDNMEKKVKRVKRIQIPERYIIPEKFEELKKEGKIGWKPAIPNNGRWRYGE